MYIVPQNKLRLGSIEDEASACRKAFEQVHVGTWVVHCHHEIPFERLTEPAENGIACILSSKPENEQALRLSLFRPLPQTVAEKLAPLDADYEAKRASLDADYRAKVAPMAADYEAKRASLDADYRAKLAPLDADYEAKRASLDADYQAKLWPPLTADLEAEWAPIHRETCIAGCPWDGKTIFLDA